MAIAFLTSLEQLAEGDDLKDDQILALNKSYASLDDTTPMSAEKLEELSETMFEFGQSKESSMDASVTATQNGSSSHDKATPYPVERQETLYDLEREGSIDEEANDSFGTTFEESEPSAEAKPQFEFKVPLEQQQTSENRTERDERESAQRFVTQLIELVPELLSKMSTVDVDDMLQTFASKFCEGIVSTGVTVTDSVPRAYIPYSICRRKTDVRRHTVLEC